MPTSGSDFGAHGRRYGMIHVIIAVALIGGATFFGYDFLRNRGSNIAAAQAWDIKGPLCAQLTLAQWDARRLKVRETTNYDGRMIGRWSGDVSCSDIHTQGGAGLFVDRICQFTNPTNLAVKTPAGEFYYDTGTGQPATLAIHKDVPKCVLASKFTRATE